LWQTEGQQRVSERANDRAASGRDSREIQNRIFLRFRASRRTKGKLGILFSCRKLFEKIRSRRNASTTFFETVGLTFSSRNSVIGYRQS
jgi:hypothetical protein